MKKLYLSILWHQHQPYYKDDFDNHYHMPWVYLHALKDYYEMAKHIDSVDNVAVTFNYVPSLLIQLQDYTDVNVSDEFLILMRKQVENLTQDERDALIYQCFMANHDNMISPIARYKSLLDKYKSGVAFDNVEVLDLSVLYILSWCGVFIRQEDEFIHSLLQKGQYFTEQEKMKLLERCAYWVSKVVDVHKELQEKGKAEIICTPYYHPILPLLADFNSAKESYPNIPMPEHTTSLDEDADWHVAEGLKEFERFFGFKPKGMWPAEGSVSQKTVPKYVANGIKWIATDEDVLANSMRMNLRDDANRHLLYMRRFQYHDGNKINIFFRDKALSDLIGFTYASWNHNDAVADFVAKLRNIYDKTSFSPHVSVILDGENAWEYYKNNAYEFFQSLYQELAKQDWIELQTFSNVVENGNIPEEALNNITAGSWIMGNFQIWIGHAEKNKAWELLTKTKTAITKHIEQKDEATKAQVYKELHIAEGSDWFWWYGDDHFSAQSNVFDRLFRNHLINIYRLLKVNVPSELFIPIKTESRVGLIRKPTSAISPSIDGKYTNFFEWLGAGEYDLKADASAMHTDSAVFTTLQFGFNSEKLYLAINADFTEVSDKVVEIDINTEKKNATYTIDLSKKKHEDSDISYSVGGVLEVAITLNSLGVHQGEKLYTSLKLLKQGTVIEKAPLYTPIEIDVFDDFRRDWLI